MFAITCRCQCQNMIPLSSLLYTTSPCDLSMRVSSNYWRDRDGCWLMTACGPGILCPVELTWSFAIVNMNEWLWIPHLTGIASKLFACSMQFYTISNYWWKCTYLVNYLLILNFFILTSWNQQHVDIVRIYNIN